MKKKIKKLLALNITNKINDLLFTKMRSTAGQLARLLCLSKLHKAELPLVPVVALQGSSYEPLNTIFAKVFEIIDRVNIETNTTDAGETIENTAVDPDELFVSLNEKFFC